MKRGDSARAHLPFRSFEDNDCFARFGEAELFSREPFHRFWIFTQVPDRGLQVRLLLFLDFNLSFEGEDALTVPFVLFKDRQIQKENAKQARGHHQDNDQLRQPLPNPEIDLLVQVRGLNAGGKGTSTQLVAHTQVVQPADAKNAV